MRTGGKYTLQRPKTLGAGEGGVLGLRSGFDPPDLDREVVSKEVGEDGLRLRTLVFGGCAFPPVSLGPAGECPCRD